jgi:hypothetical protein
MATPIYPMLPLQPLKLLYVKHVELASKIVMLENQLCVKTLQNKLLVKIVMLPQLLKAQ